MQRNIHGGDIYSEVIEYDFSVNTNPLECAQLHKELLERASVKLGHYPDPEQRRFREAVARIEGVASENVWGCNGASEGFMAIVNMLNPAKALLIDPCFAGYGYALAAKNCRIETYRLDEANDFQVGEAFIEDLKKYAGEGLDLLMFANPNNPTGKVISEDILIAILEICRVHDIKLVIDECFLRMSSSKKSMVQHINEYNGLYVVNAFTKLFSIPGIRVGYIVSQAQNIERIKGFTPEWNMSVLAHEAGVLCGEYLSDRNWQQETDRLVLEERRFLQDELRRLGLEVWDSDTCFILFCSNITDLKEELIKRRILIRDCSNYEGLGKGYYRIAVKQHSENVELIAALKDIIGG